MVRRNLVERFANRVELTNDLIDREGELRAILSSLVKLEKHGVTGKKQLIMGCSIRLQPRFFPKFIRKLAT